MKFEKEFVVRRPRDAVADELNADETIEKLFPDTQIVANHDGVRETLTHFSEMGINRDIRFVFTTRADRNIYFEKVCDGNVWRSLDGQIELIAGGPELTRVILRMVGSTRALVPEFTIKAPMREQLDQMTRSLRERLEGSS